MFQGDKGNQGRDGKKGKPWICDIKVRKQTIIFISLLVPSHTAGAAESWIDLSGFSGWERLYCPDVKCMLLSKELREGNWRDGNEPSWKKRIYSFKKTYQNVKSPKYETSCVRKLLIWHNNWVLSSNIHRVSPDRIIVVLFWAKIVVPHQVKPTTSLILDEQNSLAGIAILV